jgi:hypothetical protein
LGSQFVNPAEVRQQVWLRLHIHHGDSRLQFLYRLDQILLCRHVPSMPVNLDKTKLGMGLGGGVW